MPKYEYRCLRAVDKFRESVSHQVKFWYDVRDSGRSEPLLLTSEAGDDYADFEGRANQAFVDYLNALGNEGWKLVSYTRDIEVPYGARESATRRWPIGTYLFIREQQ